MSDVLIVSVGNSPEPIINCINSLRPERVVFFCSEGSRQQIDNVLTKVRLPAFDPKRDVYILQQRLKRNQCEQVVNELDQLDRAYNQALNLIQKVRTEAPASQILVDYTAGTKTMTAALAMAAVDDTRVQLCLTTNNRSPGTASITGHSSPVAISLASIHARRLLEQQLPDLLNRYDYAAARLAVSRILRLAHQDPATTRQLRQLEDLLLALDAWDRFDHRAALEILGGSTLVDHPQAKSLKASIKTVIGSRRLIDNDASEWDHYPSHGFEVVEDLLHNAERRASQDRFDDAVGRLYRAMELIAQLALKFDYGIETGNVDLERLPEKLRDVYMEKRVQKKKFREGKPVLELALQESFDLLAALDHQIGLAWMRKRSYLVSLLKKRNMSLFAHGFSPISIEDWNQFNEIYVAFIESAINARIEEWVHPSGMNSGRLAQLPCSLHGIAINPHSVA